MRVSTQCFPDEWMLEELAETVNVDDPRNVTMVIIILIIKLNTSADNHTDTYKH